MCVVKIVFVNDIYVRVIKIAQIFNRDVEAEAGGASGGRKFLESLEAEASKMEARRRLRLRLRKVFESFIF